MNIAVILAGGTGRRMGSEEPKQFLPVAGKTVLEHSVDAFERNDGIDGIVIVSHAQYVDRVRSMVACNGWRKVGTVLEGGAERYDSSLAAVRFYKKNFTGSELNLIFHDAARPLVSQRIIDDVCKALKIHEAVAVAVPSSDTVFEVTADHSGNRFIKNIPDRNAMFRAQTPQAFRLSLIHAAYDAAVKDPNLQATDDCGIVKKYLPDTPIYLVEGDSTNIKITYREDIELAERILRNGPFAAGIAGDAENSFAAGNPEAYATDSVPTDSGR